jgi:hypothetical protein
VIPPRLSKIYFNEADATNDRAREVELARAAEDQLRQSRLQLAYIKGMVSGLAAALVFALAVLAALAVY